MDRSEECLFSLTQNNIGPNIRDGINFVMCEQTFKLKLKRINAASGLLIMALVFRHEPHFVKIRVKKLS